MTQTAQTTQTATDEQKIRMYAGQARQALSSFAGAMVRLAALLHNPAFNVLAKMADAAKDQLEQELK